MLFFKIASSDKNINPKCAVRGRGKCKGAQKHNSNSNNDEPHTKCTHVIFIVIAAVVLSLYSLCISIELCERRYVRNHLTFKCTRNCSHFHKYVNFHSSTLSIHPRVNKSCVMDSSQNVLSLFISFCFFFLSRVGKKTSIVFLI